jgi:outer membrane murein-binding lipoprotein Lpp
MRYMALTMMLVLAGCASRSDVDALRAQVEQQETEIARLTAYVDLQGEAMRVCQEAVAGLMDYLVNMSTWGIIREWDTQVSRVADCRAAIAALSGPASE